MDTARHKAPGAAVPDPGPADSGSTTAPAAPGRAAARHRRGYLAGNQLAPRYAILAVWGAMILVYCLTEPSLFPHTGTFQTIFGSQQPLVFMTMALMCTIVVGEFVDLSVPAVFGFGATILPVLVVNHGWGLCRPRSSPCSAACWSARSTASWW